MQVATLRDKGGKNEVVAACKVQSRGRVASSKTRLTGQPAKRYKILSPRVQTLDLDSTPHPSYTRFSVPEDPARESAWPTTTIKAAD